MGILNLPSKESARAEAEQDIDKAGQIGVEGTHQPRNTLRQQSHLSFDAQLPRKTYERSAGSKRMRTELMRGDDVPHADERWNLHGDTEYQRRKKIKSRESIIISDDEMVTREDTSDASRPEDTSISLGLEIEVITQPSATNGDVPECRDLERRMAAGREGKSSSVKTNTSRLYSREPRKSLRDLSSQSSSPQFEEISDDEVYSSPKAEEPYRLTRFLPRGSQATKRPDRTRPRQVLQEVKVVRQTETKSAYFPPSGDQRHASRQRLVGRLTDPNSPVNSRDFFKREGPVDDSPDVLHSEVNVGVRNLVQTRDLATTNGHSGPARRSWSPQQESSSSTYAVAHSDSTRRKAETPGQITARARNNKPLQRTIFRLKRLIYGPNLLLSSNDHEYYLEFDFANGDARVVFKCQCRAPECSAGGNRLAFPAIKVVKIAWHDSKVQITLCKDGTHDNVLLLDFLGESGAFRFLTYLRNASKCDNILPKDREFMEKVFQNSEKQRQTNSSKYHRLRSPPESRSEMELDQDAIRIQHNKERQRLRGHDGQLSALSIAKRRRSESSERRPPVQQQTSASDVKVNTFETNHHGTRSRIRSDKINQDLDEWGGSRRSVGEKVPEHQESKFSELKREHEPWDKYVLPAPNEYQYSKGIFRPLVFPLNGPRKTTVDFGDLERLDEGEFLNDNIIAFYLRYLERDLEITHPAIAKRVYFFNTFFYERLTSRSSGKRGINYEGVQKWTSKIDIFNFDYVVVPVNESAHWYVAIICNLPNISRALSQEEEMEDDLKVESSDRQNDFVQADEPSSPHSSRQSPAADAIDLDYGVIEAGEQVARISLIQKEMAERARNLDSMCTPEISGIGNVEDESWPAADENPPINLTDSIPSISPEQTENASPDGELNRARIKAQCKPKKAKRKLSLRKYNVDDPVIVTLDSLGLTHSLTARNLKEYLIEEGKSKRQLRILIEDISAMNSKEIPLQNNFCDCGIYLLIYIEKFLKDPRSFVNGILRREMDQKSDWPDINPSIKRDHLRNLLLHLYKEQNDTRRQESTDKGRYHKATLHATHQGGELSNDSVGWKPKGNQRKPELSETGHDTSIPEAAAASAERASEACASGRLGSSPIVVGGHPRGKQPGLAIEGDGSSRTEPPTIVETQYDSQDLGSLHESASRRIRKDLTRRVDANMEPTRQLLTESTSSGKPLDRFLQKNSKARNTEIAGIEIVVSPRRRTRNRRSSPELNDGSIILD
ncbi:hypothetical protein GP486_003885 [Trichoglossum hirsutum]|uniref:Ubiquitin-like protease family profile domain-containing protein n=1 Tax=Trichoglossum hirsutum TaxID=265104 RepID=A0A9P8RQ05_9PEZI|nr:hypothetical protein GP486_003885 [Trichoglossum hirsutum]